MIFTSKEIQEHAKKLAIELKEMQKQIGANLTTLLQISKKESSFESS
jgi:hypothetical protein